MSSEDTSGDSSNVECETCGRDDFTTETAMKIHHKRIHGVSLAGFDKICKTCGKEFTASQRKIQHCSSSCFGKSNETSFENLPEGNGWATLECEICESEYEVVAAKADGSRFCSISCRGVWQSAFMSSESGPNYKHGNSGYDYGEGWDRGKREMVRDRDDRMCQDCGMQENECIEVYGKVLSVHHIRNAREFDDPAERNHESNLISLCNRCHGRWEQIYPLRPRIVA